MKKWEYAQQMGLTEEAVDGWNTEDSNDLLEMRRSFVSKATMELETLRYYLIHSEEEETYDLVAEVNGVLYELEVLLQKIEKHHEELEK